MNAILLVTALLCAPGPDYAQLVPAIVEAAETTFRAETDEHIAIHMQSFVREMRRDGIAVSLADVANALERKGRSYEDRRGAVVCDEKPCQWGIASSRLYVKLNSLEIADTGVRVEVEIKAKTESLSGFVSNVVVYEMEWRDETWHVGSETVILRS